jgi:hypothetical protein
MSSQWSLIGEGEVFLGLRFNGMLRSVGQCKQFKMDVSEESKELKNYQGGGGLADQVSWIAKIEVSLEFASLSAKNLAMAMRGEDSSLAAATVTDQLHTAYQGGYLPLAGIGPTMVSVTVNPSGWITETAYALGDLVKPTTGTHFYKCTTAGSSGLSEPTWKTDGTTNTDGTVTWTDMGTMELTAAEFEVRKSGIFIPEVATKIAPTGTPVKVTYTKTAGTIIETLINAASEYHLVFDGSNFARDGKPMSVDLYRVKFSPPKELSFIGDDFASLTLTGSVLQDDTKIGTGISKFASIKMVEA